MRKKVSLAHYQIASTVVVAVAIAVIWAIIRVRRDRRRLADEEGAVRDDEIDERRRKPFGGDSPERAFVRIQDGKLRSNLV